MKAVAEALSAIMLLGVMIGVVSSVYFWGLPLVQKNKDVTSLRASESFMNELANKIKEVVNSPGRQKLTIRVSGEVSFDGTQENQFTLTVKTDSTIYSIGGLIPLGRNDCSPNTGTFGMQDYATLCMISNRVGEKFETIYKLKFIQLDTEGIDSFKIAFSGTPNLAQETHVITIENTGTTTEDVDTRKIRTAHISVDIGV